MHVYNMLEVRWGNRSGNFVYKMQNEIILRGAGKYSLHKKLALMFLVCIDQLTRSFGGPKHYTLHRMICHHS